MTNGAAKRKAKRAKQDRYSHPKYTVAQVVAAVQASSGLLTMAAERLGCPPQTIYNYRDAHPEVAEAIQNAREHTTDVAETALYAALKERQGWAVCFYLKTQGKNRGFIERHEHELSSPPDKPLRIEVVYRTQPVDLTE